jgi:hypothetical protein
MTGTTRQSLLRRADEDRKGLTLDTRDNGAVGVGLEPREDSCDGRVGTTLIDGVAEPRRALCKMTRTLLSILRSRESTHSRTHQYLPFITREKWD